MTSTARSSITAMLAAAVVICASASALHAEMIEKTGTFAGLSVTYKVVLPTGYDPSRAYPAVLVFAGGGQSLDGATRTVESTWRKEAERRGYIIVSPASPDGSLFYEGAGRIFPEFIGQMLRDYTVRGQLHIAGASNGGISALHVAARYPQYFATVTGYPGMLDRQDVGLTAALKNMCLFLHVGERDAYWLALMQEQAKALTARGVDVRFTVEKGQNHGLRADEIDLSRRMFEQIESCVR